MERPALLKLKEYLGAGYLPFRAANPDVGAALA